ncbi:MAG: GAF domain-containing protein [Candidatus Eisenbacteria bacterium]|nr:GAF domain-containing protein [Candidatus Eisenbacteria bacterium]
MKTSENPELKDAAVSAEEIRQSCDTQTIINSLMRLSLEEMPLEELLDQALRAILLIPWLTPNIGGGIFLADERSETLELKAQRGLSKEVQSTCKRISFGECVCGLAASTRKTQFVDHLHDHNQNCGREVSPHGHYCVPILSGKRILGVMNIYLETGHCQNEKEEEFLSVIANTLAAAIVHKWGEGEQSRLRTRLGSLWRIASMVDADLQTLCDQILSEIGPMTESQFCFFGFLNKDETTLTVNSWSRDVMQACQVQDKPLEFPIATAGVWADAVRERKVLIINNYDAPRASKKGCPEGHVPIARLLVVPVFSGDRIAVVAAVANKETEYTEGDAKQLTAFLTSVQLILDRRRAQEALEEEQRLFLGGPVIAFRFRWTPKEDMTIEYISPNVEQYGFKVEDFTSGRITFAGVVHPEDMERVNSEMMARIESGASSYEQEYRVICPDGRIVWVHDFNIVKRNGGGEVTHCQGYMLDITERKKAESALQESRQMYETLVRMSPDAVIVVELPGRIGYVSERVLKLHGFESADEIVGKPFSELVVPGDREKTMAHFKEVVANGSACGFTCDFLRADGSSFTGELNCSVINDARGNPKAVIGTVRDITSRLEMEEQLHQSQKMEAIGQLAGGLAHDFNNMLTSMIGHSKLLLNSLEEDSPLRRNVEKIEAASERAAWMTRQLLAYSSKQILELRVLELNSIVAKMEPLLRSVVGENIEISTAFGCAACRVRVDVSQFEQIIMNLAINAREAMPLGGKLIIETASVYLDETYVAQHHAVKPGQYCMLAVSDTGCGMDEETQSHIFEPFFTTRDKSKGAGLGLATVYGTVKQSGGDIWVYSKPGKGTTFKIYIPQVSEKVEVREAGETGAEAHRGSETILLVEDDENVRGLVFEILEMNGYRVLPACNGAEAVLIAEQHEGPIDLMVTDVVMPGMSGKELALSLSVSRHEMKVLYMSGYTDDAIVHHGVLDPGTVFLQKPFTPDQLAKKVRRVLDAGRRQALQQA